MKNKLIYVAVVALAAACGRDSRQSATQQSYETVQEGSAAGVTSTIQGPGEVMPPLTGTNADTTSAFALNPNAIPQTPAPGYAATSATDFPMADPNAGTSYQPAPVRPAPRVATSPSPGETRPDPAQRTTQPAETRQADAPPAPPVDATSTTSTTSTSEAATSEPADDDAADAPAEDPPPATTTTQGDE